MKDLMFSFDKSSPVQLIPYLNIEVSFFFRVKDKMGNLHT